MAASLEVGGWRAELERLLARVGLNVGPLSQWLHARLPSPTVEAF